jgi:hypothetical protein
LVNDKLNLDIKKLEDKKTELGVEEEHWENKHVLSVSSRGQVEGRESETGGHWGSSTGKWY